MRTHVIEGGGGIDLHVRDVGSLEAPPIVLVHGWSQHHVSWLKQFESSLVDEFRLVAMDLRGHGQSERPHALESYTTGSLWADDIAAIISSLQLISPVLVASSYGGLVVGDYLRSYRDHAIGGVNLVCAAVGIGVSWFGSSIGDDFVKYAPLATSEDQPTALKAIQDLVHLFFAKDVSGDLRELAMGWSMLTPAVVREHLISRDENFLPDYAQVRKPLLVSYGTADKIVLPAMAEAIRQSCPNCHMSEYVGSGHFPFIEDSARFNRELGEFVREARVA